MMLKRSDIVQIPFPFSDLAHHKRRPVLLLTAPDAFGDFLAAAVTSQAGHDDAISLHDDDINEGRLPKASWVRATKLFSLNREIAIVTLGNLKPEAFGASCWVTKSMQPNLSAVVAEMRVATSAPRGDEKKQGHN